MQSRAILGIAAVSCAIALVVLSWLPKGMEIRTGIAGQIEHAIAYAGTGLIAGLAWPRRAVRFAATLIALAAVLEIGQIWVPGRTAQIVDFASSGAGAVVGVSAAAALVGSVFARRPDA